MTITMVNMRAIIISLLLITFNILIVAQPAMEGDWSRVRMYGHGFRNGDYTAEQYNFIRDNYGMFCIEKRHAKDVYGGNPSTEVAAAATAKKIVAANPDCKVLMYWSTNTAYTSFYTTVADAISENPGWIDPSNDRYVYPDDCKDWWVATADSLVSNTPEIYGIFADGAPGAESRGQIANVNDNLGALTALSCFNIYNGYRVASTTKTYAGATTIANSNGVYCEAFFRTPVDTPAEGVKLMDLLLAIPSDKYIVCRGAGDVFSTSVDFFLASFLIVANNKSFFTWGGVENSYAADNSLIYWNENLNKYIGTPLGKAVKNGYIYTRKFKNCSVSVNLQNSETSIIWGATVPRGENIALNGAATQSSTDGGAASLAIDGNKNGALANGSVTQTNSESNAWWQVDLGSSYPVGEISVHTRTDACCIDDLADFTVFVLDNNNDTTYSKYYRTAPDTAFTFDAGGAIGKTIKVQSHLTSALSLAEVEVYQYQHAIDFAVSDSIGSQSLSDVSFTINSFNYTTDNSGEAKAYLAEGLYDITFTKPGYLSKTISVNLPAHSTVSVELVKESCDLTFNVNEKVNGLMIQGASIEINDSLLTTNAQGSVSINNLFSDVYPYTITKDGYDLYSSSINLVKDTSLTIEMAREKYTLGFKFKDNQTDASISAISISINDTIVETNSQGEYSSEFDYGEYAYTVSKEGYQEASGTIMLEKDTIVRIALSALTSGIMQNEYGIKIFPNPSSDILYVKGLPKGVDVKYQIVNTLGAMVKEGVLTEQLHVTELNKGMYVICLQLNDMETYRHILINQ